MDRLRALLEQRRAASAADARLDAQIKVLHRRVKILRGSLHAATTCVLALVLFILDLNQSLRAVERELAL